MHANSHGVLSTHKRKDVPFPRRRYYIKDFNRAFYPSSFSILRSASHGDNIV